MIPASIFELFAAFDLDTLLWLIPIILKVAIGLGAVIFVHELGHFLMAKACGVKIEKFMIGFDIGGYKIAWRRGETLYGIGILPLGGYVKMLGQDDDPAHISEQMKKSEVDDHGGNGVPIKGPNGETYYIDRRSYLAKSVPQRMAIISAGVVMNVIFAFIFAVIAYAMGVPYEPSIVAQTVPGSPAWQEGLEPGDEIVQIGNRVDPSFIQLKGGVTLGDLENGLKLVVRRGSDPDKPQPLNLTPVQKDGKLATIGINGPVASLVLIEESPFSENSAAARAKLISPTDDKADAAKFASGDKIIAINDQPVADYRGYLQEISKAVDQPVRVTVRRSLNKDKTVDDPSLAPEEAKELTFEIPANPANRIGFRLKPGPIAAVRKDSIADKAGLKVGDVIDRVDDKQLGEGTGLEAWDAETLPNYFRRAAAENRTVKIRVQRPTGKDASEEITAEIKPVQPTTSNASGIDSPMGVDELGLAYTIDNEVMAIVPDTAAAATEVSPGDKLLKATLKFPAEKGVNLPVVPLELGEEQSNWPLIVDLIQFAPEGTEIEFEIQRGKEEKTRTVSIKPAAVADSFTTARGLHLAPVQRVRKADSFGQAVRFGWDETVDSLTMVVRFLQKIGTQVPASAFGGPISIARAAGSEADKGVPSLLIFLTMLSANLAVINFLPIPLLDGGHMVFLLYEWVRGRPANERFVVAMHTVGFVFIVSLMLYVIALDLELIPRNL